MLRSASRLALLLGLAPLLSVGCGPEGEDSLDSPGPCEVGSALLNEILGELQSNAPACASDLDCVQIPLRVECAGSSVDFCGAVVHSRVAEHYDQAQANARFCASFKPSKFGCALTPGCVASAPACEAGRCVSRPVVR